MKVSLLTAWKTNSASVACTVLGNALPAPKKVPERVEKSRTITRNSSGIHRVLVLLRVRKRIRMR
jgi:hypothetical protein